MRIAPFFDTKRNRQGIPSGPSFPVDTQTGGPVAAGALLCLLLGVLLLGLPGSLLAQQRVPRPFPRLPRSTRPNPGPAQKTVGGNQPPARSEQEKQAIALLRQMQHPLADYTGEETTRIFTQGGHISQQTIKGNTKGLVVRYYTAPAFLAGDIMLTGPNRYVYYRAKTGTVTRTPESNHDDERDRQINEGIRQRIFTATLNGNELVAGRNAAIVLVTSTNPQNRGYAKFWIDAETHIKLKIEIANAAGDPVSTSEITSIKIGPAAQITPQDFAPPQFAAARAKEFTRVKVASLKDAVAQLPFRPLEPGNLPPGFHLQGIVVIVPVAQEGQASPTPERRALFLRYTDGVAAFTLQEHPVRGPGAVRPAPQGMAQRWRVPIGSGDLYIEVVYRGHLPPQQEQALHDSLRPINY